MIDVNSYLEHFCAELRKCFGERIRFVGLQGSYGRGEAGENSDLDIVVILDRLSACDVEEYGSLLDRLPHRERICGFLSGEQELLSWEPSDLLSFYFDTIPLAGDLDALAERIDDDAAERAVRIGACNLYHGCVHNMVHEKDAGMLKELYKSAGFVIQADHYRKTGVYLRQRDDLSKAVPEEEKAVLQILAEKKREGWRTEDLAEGEFLALSEILLEWVGGLLRALGPESSRRGIGWGGRV